MTRISQTRVEHILDIYAGLVVLDLKKVFKSRFKLS